MKYKSIRDGNEMWGSLCSSRGLGRTCGRENQGGRTDGWEKTGLNVGQTFEFTRLYWIKVASAEYRLTITFRIISQRGCRMHDIKWFSLISASLASRSCYNSSAAELLNGSITSSRCT